jgi:hypothetical protein
VAFPVWEWAIGEDELHVHDESFLRPTAHQQLPGEPAGHFIVAAEATLSDGTVLPACAEVTINGRQRRIAPMFVILNEHHLDFAGAETTGILSRYTKRLNTYPVRWKLAVLLAGESRLRGGRVRRALAQRLGQMWLGVRLRLTSTASRVPSV